MSSHWHADEHYWALRFNDGSDLDGSLVGVYYEWQYTPPRVQALTTALFATRKAARQFVRETFGNDRGRPVPVKITVCISATTCGQS